MVYPTVTYHLFYIIFTLTYRVEDVAKGFITIITHLVEVNYVTRGRTQI